MAQVAYARELLEGGQTRLLSADGGHDLRAVAVVGVGVFLACARLCLALALVLVLGERVLREGGEPRRDGLAQRRRDDEARPGLALAGCVESRREGDDFEQVVGADDGRAEVPL